MALTPPGASLSPPAQLLHVDEAARAGVVRLEELLLPVAPVSDGTQLVSPRAHRGGARHAARAALARLEAWNAQVRAVRCRIEKVFGTWKRSYGLRRMRWLGLAKAGLQVRLTAMAYNLRRSATLLRAREV